MALIRSRGASKRPLLPWRLPIGIKNAPDDDLERVIGTCELAEKVCAGVVVAGVVLEFALAFSNVPYDSVLGRSGALTADAMIAFGIVGEVLFSTRASGCQGELTRRSKEELARASKEAGEAKERAAELEREAAALKLDLEKLRTPRKLGDRHSALVEAIKPLASELSRNVHVGAVADSEAQMYAAEILRAFVEAGVTLTPPFVNPIMQYVSSTTDLTVVWSRKHDGAEALGMKLSDALRSAGFTVNFGSFREILSKTSVLIMAKALA